MVTRGHREAHSCPSERKVAKHSDQSPGYFRGGDSAPECPVEKCQWWNIAVTVLVWCVVHLIRLRYLLVGLMGLFVLTNREA